MSVTYLEPEGIIVTAEALELPRAKAVAELVSGRDLPFVKYVECRQHRTTTDETAETIVFDVEVERPQHSAHDVHRIERIAVTFEPADKTYPEVLALRADFPHVPHTNVRPTEFPRSLCLYEQSWPQVTVRWTPISFLERIRFWLAETAKRTLHQADQPLEPLLLGSGYQIILPSDLFSKQLSEEYEELQVGFAQANEDCRVMVARREKAAGGLSFLAICLIAKPQTHGAIRHAPNNLQELDEFLQSAGLRLLDALRTKLRDWDDKTLLKKKLLIVVGFPLMREGTDTVEASDTWVFLTTKSVEEVGVDIGIWEKTSDGLGHIYLQLDENRNGQTIGLEVVSPIFDSTRDSAARASGYKPSTKNIVSVGVGALGSQVAASLVSSGFGVWRFIDSDVFLPHNTARHELGRWAIGLSKAEAMSLAVGQILNDVDSATSTTADILRPGKNADSIEQALVDGELILDMAAEIPVSRYLAHETKSSARRIAVFLNPRGTDLVMLCEDAQRTIALDCLEMQYYRAVASEPALVAHLKAPDGRIRYARSCRDVSSTIPSDLVSMHAAIASRAIRTIDGQNDAAIRIWRADEATSEVRLIEVSTVPSYRQTIGAWTLVLDDFILKKIASLRGSKLPRETGGVLIGSYDFVRKTVYVVDTIPSPPDSEEWPTLYIRGCKGLFQTIESITNTTGGQLEYVGEWHSHPDSYPCLPSDDDLKVFGWLTTKMGEADLPALMAIAGQGPRSAWFLGEMLRTGGHEVTV